MIKQFLRDAIVLIVGKPAEEIADFLNSNKHVNEFLIAKRLGITINQTRNLLYKISDQGLVSSIRKKDKRKGWFTYFWRIEILKSLEFLKGVFLKRAKQINNQINSRESKQFYACEKCNIEFNEENALLHDFTCSECGSVFVLKDNSAVLKELRKNLNKLNKELAEIEVEIAKEKEELDKKNIKEVKKRKKESDQKRADNRLLRKKEAEKSRKIFTEKKIKKVVKEAVKKKIKRIVSKKVPKKPISKKKIKKR